MSTIQYLSGCDRLEIRTVAGVRSDLGLMTQPASAVQHWASYYPFWAADNGCFAQGDRFDLDRYLGWLAGLDYRQTCLWATAPDVMGDAVATWARSEPVLAQIRDLGYRAAFVAQDGLCLAYLDHPWQDGTRWDAFDCLFIGGSTNFKLSASDLVIAAKQRGKLVHMGRVNSRKRLALAQSWGCDSADGTYLKFGPAKNLPKLVGWLEELNGAGR